MISSENGSHAEYFRRVVKLISIAFLAVFITTASYLNQFIASYGQQTGSIALTVVHTDGSPVKPEDFLPGSWSDNNGYYSLYDSDDNLVGTFPTCNFSPQAPCEAGDGIVPGSYVAVISLNFGSGLLGQDLGVYSESIRVEEGSPTDVTISTDFGYVKTSVTGVEGNELATSEFLSSYSRVEGYYSIYDEQGNFVIDAESCNTTTECKMPLETGIYEARVTNSNESRRDITPFEVSENSVSQLKIVFEDGKPPAGTGSNNGGSDSDDDTNDPSSSSNANLQREPIRVLNHTSYIDQDSGFYRVVGEIQNLGMNPAHEITIHGIFYEGDEIVAVKQGFSLQSVLAPGGISSFEIEIKSTSISPSITNYTLTVPTSERTTEVKQQNLGINITRQYYDTDTRLYHLEGIVVNYGSAVASFVRVIATAYDLQSRPIFVTSKYTNSHLDNGNPSTFEIVFAPNYDVHIATVSAIVESDEYSMVKEGFLKSPITLTLDSSSYDNGMFVEINGTVGSFLTTEPYAVIKILWPDGIQEDSDLVKVSSDGSYSTKMQFFSQPEYLGKTFTVRTSYGVHYADKHFVFAQSCIPSDLWGMIVASALDDTNDRAEIEQCLSSLALEVHDSRIVTPSSPLRVEASNITGARVEFSVTLAANGTSGFGQPLCIPRSGSVFPVGNTTILCITGDHQGNSAVATFIMSVQDNTPPQMVPPPDVTIELLPNANGTVAASDLSLGFPVVLDLVDTSPTVINNAPEAFPTGKTIVLWTSSDASDNTAMVNQTVTVIAIPGELEGSVQVASSREAVDNYETKYSSQAPDETNPLVFQPEYRLYRPAQNVVIFGLVHESLLSTFVDGIASVNFKLVDEKGGQVGEPVPVMIDPITGAFSSAGILLPQQLSPGVYKLQSEVKVDLEKARALIHDDSQLQKLESLGDLNNLQDLIVGGSDTYLVNEEGQQFKVHIASNAHLCCNRYSNDERKMAFESIIANSSSVNTVAEVAVPKFLLDGQISVFIDGRAISAESVVLKDTNEAGNSSMTILEVNYGSGAHTVEIYGTNVVPEFPLISYLLPLVAIIVIIYGLLLRKTRFHNLGELPK